MGYELIKILCGIGVIAAGTMLLLLGNYLFEEFYFYVTRKIINKWEKKARERQRTDEEKERKNEIRKQLLEKEI